MKESYIIFAILFVALPTRGLTQSTANLPERSLMVAGAQFTTDAYVDMGTFERRINPLDDRGESVRQQDSFDSHQKPPRASLYINIYIEVAQWLSSPLICFASYRH